MEVMKVARSLAVVVVTTAFCLLTPSPAGALSCGGVDQGSVVIVGTVVSVSNPIRDMVETQGTWARVAVEEVWRGGGAFVGDRVEIRGGPKSTGGGFVPRNMGESTFELGQRYVVNADPGTVTPAADPHNFYWETPPGVLAVRLCTIKPQPWSTSTETFRPPDATILPAGDLGPEPWPQDPSSSSPPYAVFGSLAIGAMLAIVLYRRNRRRSFDRASVGVPM
jgi:hypothetical protein